MATVPPLTSWDVAVNPTSTILNTRIRDAINFLTAVPMGIFRKNVAQSVSNNTWTALSWEVEDLDTDGGHSNVTNNSRYTSATAGWYLCTTTLHWQANNTGHREARFRKNGDNTEFYGWNSVYVDDGAEAANLTTTAYIYLDVGDYIEVMAKQSSGVTLTVFVDGGDPRMEIRWVGVQLPRAMNLPTPRTWSPGLLSAAELNIDVRDTLEFTLGTPAARLEKRGQPESVPAWIYPQKMGDVTWDSITLDTHGGADSSGYTVVVPGIYHVVSQLQWHRTGDNLSDAQLFRVNGQINDFAVGLSFYEQQPDSDHSMVVSGYLPLNAGDHVAVMAAYNSSGTEVQIMGYDGAQAFGSVFDIRWLSKL